MRIVRRAVTTTALLVGGLAFSLLLAEAVLRFFDGYRPPPPRFAPRKEALYRTHETLGYHLWPSAEISYRYPPNNPLLRTVVSNSDGLRSAHDFDAPHDGLRVLVTGDSFVFGEGVDADERLTEALGRLEPDWRVDNLGMTGWGVDLMLRAVRWIAPRIRPDVVVVCIYTDDFRRAGPNYFGMGFPVPKFRLDGGRLVSVPFTPLSVWERTRLNQARLYYQWKYTDVSWRLHEVILDEFRALAEELDFALALSFLPGRSDTRNDQRRRAWVAAYAERTGVPFVDLTEPLHSLGVYRTYIEKNWHWNAEGHRIAAEHIHQLLRESVVAEP